MNYEVETNPFSQVDLGAHILTLDLRSSYNLTSAQGSKLKRTILKSKLTSDSLLCLNLELVAYFQTRVQDEFTLGSIQKSHAIGRHGGIHKPHLGTLTFMDY